MLICYDGVGDSLEIFRTSTWMGDDVGDVGEGGS